MENLAFEISSVYTPYLNVLAEELGDDNIDFKLSCNEHDLGYEYDLWSECLDETENPSTLQRKTEQLAQLQLLNGMLFLIYERPPGIVSIQNLYKSNQKVHFIKEPASEIFDFEEFLKSKQDRKKKPIADILL